MKANEEKNSVKQSNPWTPMIYMRSSAGILVGHYRDSGIRCDVVLPVVLGNFWPEEPYRNHRQKGEEGLKERAVDSTRCALTDVTADCEVENLASGKKESWAEQEEHRPDLTQDLEHEVRLEHDIEDDPEERYNQVEHIERNVPVGWVVAVIPEVGELEAGIKRNVADADQEHQTRTASQEDRQGCTIIH